MNVVTNRKVVVRPASAGSSHKEGNSGIDGSSSKSSVISFQRWFNKNKGGKLKVDGKWGPKTSKAWSSAGSEYDAAMINTAQSALLFGNTSVPGGISTPATSKTDPSGRQNPGHVWDKAKGLWQKAQDVVGKGKAIADSAGKTTSSSTTQTLPDSPDHKAEQNHKKKILIWTGVGIAALVTGILIYKSSKKGK